jgi:hypothetical protein
MLGELEEEPRHEISVLAGTEEENSFVASQLYWLHAKGVQDSIGLPG